MTYVCVCVRVRVFVCGLMRSGVVEDTLGTGAMGDVEKMARTTSVSSGFKLRRVRPHLCQGPQNKQYVLSGL
jgi:hypothetical protein